MASVTLSKVNGLHTIAVIFCLVSAQLPVSSGYIASVLGSGEPHIKNSFDASRTDHNNADQRKDSGKIGLQHSGENGNEGIESGAPTYIPFLSSRVLSNIPKFFEHLRENLEALQQDEGIEREGEDGGISGGGDFGEIDESRFEPGARENDDGKADSYDRLMSSTQWQPAPIMGVNGRYSNMRSFVRQPSGQENYLRRAHNYNPSWLYTNLGLGRRRRGR